MIAYVDCIPMEPSGKCWNRTYYEDKDELLPLYSRKLSNLQPKTEGSLRRRLLTSKIHQQQDALWNPKCWEAPPSPKIIPAHHPPPRRPEFTFSRPLHQEWTAVSSLDEESKWSVHYTAPWNQQENVFLPGSRPPCVEELHLQAKVNLKTVLRECDKLRKDGFRSSQYYSQGPEFSSHILCSDLDHEETEKKKKSKVLDCLSLCCPLKSWRKKSSESSGEEEKLVYSMGSQTPLLENTCDLNSPNTWSKSLPLPTPEEKMRQQANTVATDIIPIDITGESFDRQASFRRTLSNTDTVIRRSKRVKRRKTITGVPDDVQTELAKGKNDVRTHSMYMAGQFSNTGHEGNSNATLKHSSGTHESGCPIEEVKRVPPSMRRIRAQRGCGIAAQMANISLCSSNRGGSISSMSDCNGAVYSPLRNGGEQGFHSLPRQGAQTSLQKQEPNYTSSPYKGVNGSTNSLPYQVNMQHSSPSSWQMFTDPRNELISSKTAEFQGFPNGQYSPTSGYMVSGQDTCPSPFAANGSMQNFSDFGSVHSAQSFETVETLQSIPSGPSDHLFGIEGSSRCHSPASLQTTIHTETESQCSTLNGSTCNSPSSARRDSNFSESSAQSCSTMTVDQWTYERPPKKGQRTSSCSSPVSNVYNSLERSPTKTDSCSLFSVDNEGYYTSMHMDSGLKSHSHGAINRAGKARHNMYDCREHHSQGDSVSLHSNRSLSRSISLRKAKKPPLPPKRTDSLRRKPHRKPHQSEMALNEQMISSLQESLKNNSNSSASPSGEFEDPWVLRPRSQSTVSAASSGISAPATVCPVTPTNSDGGSSHCSSQRSEYAEYAESWDFYMDFPRSHSDQGPSSPTAGSASARESGKGLTNGFPSDKSNRSRLKLNIVTSPDKAANQVTSPSSGYSSQSITPTTGTPVTYVLRAKSPAGRPKPKVPERKSSLRSSVSSSTTSLSSNTSDSCKNLPTPPPLPAILPGLCTLQDAQSLSRIPVSNCSTDAHPLPFPPPLVVNCTLEKGQSSPPLSPPTTTEQCSSRASSSTSQSFPPPPSSESSDSLIAEEDAESPPSSPPPPPPLPIPLPPSSPNLSPLHRTFPFRDLTLPSPPPLPGTGLHAETVLKATNSRTTLEPMEDKERSSSKQPKERLRLQRPRITAQALQLVQLKPIKLMKLESIFTEITTTVCTSQDQEPLQEPSETDILEDSSTPDLASQFDNEFDTQESPEEEFTDYMLQSLAQAQVPSSPGKPVCRTYSVEFLLDAKSVSTPVDLQRSPMVPSMATRSISQEQKPPISPKKPGLTLIMPPSSPQKATVNCGNSEDNGAEIIPSEEEAINSASLKVTDSDDLTMVSSELEVEAESESGNSTPVGSRKISLSSEFSSDSLNDPQFSAFIFSEHDLGLSDTDLGLSDKDLGLSDDKGITDDGSSSSSGSISFKDDDNEDNGAAFDSSTDISSTTSSPNEETVEEMVTPARPRTTEDLFAAIHRSKRKVLGRGDSEEERSRHSPPSPPVTPTGTSPVLPVAPQSRQTGSIQRNLRRSTTSNDNFKALLLKKGSRTDPGVRMSAAEILKFTDPRLQRPGSEPPDLDAPCASPGRSRRAAEEWARAEGALPRLSPSLTSSKYGRSSTPPSAASSRYNSRCRALSGPMTAICEKDGELAETVDCCLAAEMSFPMSLTSGGMVCAQGSS